MPVTGLAVHSAVHPLIHLSHRTRAARRTHRAHDQRGPQRFRGTAHPCVDTGRQALGRRNFCGRSTGRSWMVGQHTPTHRPLDVGSHHFRHSHGQRVRGPMRARERIDLDGVGKPGPHIVAAHGEAAGQQQQQQHTAW
jgi:hypothetical protein